MLHALILGAVVMAQVPAPAPSAGPSIAPSPVPSPTPAGPLLSVSPAAVNLNPAQQQIVAVAGATAPLQATLDQRLVNVTVAPNAASVTITATQATGNDVLHLVDAGGARADVAIRVAFNAGTIVAQTTLNVTGNPVDPAWLARQVSGWVTRLSQALPGAQTTIGTVATPVTPLAPGQGTQFVVPVQISGAGQYFDQSGTTTVYVRNVALQPFVPALLFYDDDPEHVTQDGVLFRGTVTAAQPSRLYYYHDDAQDPRRIVVALASGSQDPTSVQLVESSAGPNMDVMHVGNTVTRNFLLTKARGEGVILDLPQDQPYLWKDVPMTARQGVAGNVDLRVLSGGPVIVTVLAVSPGVDPRGLLAQPVLPDDGHHRNGVFSLAGIGTGALAYTSGAGDAKLAIGDTDSTPANADPKAVGHDYGDYGVLHTIDVTLANPSNASATAYLYFRPLGGVARASFLVNGTAVDLGCMRVPVPYQIATFDLAPGQTSHALVQTMTDGGSFYPVEVGVTATAPRPAAPPIDAPDGCFPKPPTTMPQATPLPQETPGP